MVAETLPSELEAPISQHLTEPDQLLLKYLIDESQEQSGQNGDANAIAKKKDGDQKAKLISTLEGMNDVKSQIFEPTVFVSWDTKDFPNDKFVRPILDAYIRIGCEVARYPTDVVFVTHLIMYFLTSVPSAMYLYYNFTYMHGVLHLIMTGWFIGSYTIMRHNHIHNNGVLSQKYHLFDILFPYLLDPLMGHTWNSYYYHHVKHHHVEGNGPGDLSTTIRLQRDEWSSLAYYIGRFTLLIWLELPLYFFRTGKMRNAASAAFWEWSNYVFFYFALKFNTRASIFVLMIPFTIVRLGLMVGNFGQHAFVDELEPDSDYRSSITLIDIPSNRYCFNDGYHTAHHLNPRRHWRQQPLSFLKGKPEYENGRALVFKNIDYLEITFRLMKKDYDHLARCLVPISAEQRQMSHDQIKEMLKTKTKKFSEEDIRKFWKQK